MSVVSAFARNSLIGTSPNVIMEELARAAPANSLAASPLIPLLRVSTTFRDRLTESEMSFSMRTASGGLRLLDTALEVGRCLVVLEP